jgi:hypothetical protein
VPRPVTVTRESRLNTGPAIPAPGTPNAGRIPANARSRKPVKVVKNVTSGRKA